MKFTLMNGVFNPTDGALIPGILEKGREVAQDTVSVVVGEYLRVVFHWLYTNGLPLIVEGLMVWSLMCLLIAISGNSKWLERGAKSFLFSVLLGVVSHAV